MGGENGDEQEAAMSSVEENARPAITAEVIGLPSEADGIMIAVGPPGAPTSVFGLEYPMRMVDQQMVALRELAIQVHQQRRGTC